MTPETAELVCDKARAAFLRTDGVQVDDAELVNFDDYRCGKYVLLRRAGEVVAVYKMRVTSGPARGDGKGAFVIDSLSVGVKRIKRAPKGLLPVTD